MRALVFASLVLAAQDSPITRVVNLIEELQSRIEADGKQEELLWNRYACWCENMTKKKADTIHETRREINQAMRKVLKNKSIAATKKHQIEKAEKAIQDAEDAIAQAVNLRNNAKTEYDAKKADAAETLEALQRAIKALQGAGTKTAFLQSPELAALKSRLSTLMVGGTMSEKQMSLAAQIVVPDHIKGRDKADTYSPQSATIQGILKDMYSQFAQDVQEADVEEAKQNKDHEEFVADQNSTIALEQKKKERYEVRKAEAEATEAEATALHTDKTEQLEHDSEFFSTTKKACEEKKEEYDTRESLRTEELQGIEEALKLLKKNRGLFSSAIKPGQETVSFLQMTSPRMAAFRALRDGAQATKSLRLAALAANVKMSDRKFTAVLKAIDDMFKTLDEEERKDFQDREWCQTTQHQRTEDKKNFLFLSEKAQDQANYLQRKIDTNKDEISQCTKDKAAANNTRDELLDQRTAENSEFLEAKDEDEQAVEVLRQVIGHLSKFYKKNEVKTGKLEEMNLAQEPEFEVSEEQAPDATLSDKGNRSKESKGIISTLTMIKTDLENEIKSGIQNEAQAQTEYEAQDKDLRELIANLKAQIVELEEANSELSQKKNEQETTRDNNKTNAGDEQELIDGDQPRCDQLVNTFEQRREKRALEKQGLTQARDFLSAAPDVSLLTTTQDKFAAMTFRNIQPH